MTGSSYYGNKAMLFFSLFWMQRGTCVQQKQIIAISHHCSVSACSKLVRVITRKCWYQLPCLDEWQNSLNSMNTWINKQDKNLCSVDLSHSLSLSAHSLVLFPNLHSSVFPSVFCFHELMNNLRILRTVCIHLAFSFSAFIHKLVIRKC